MAQTEPGTTVSLQRIKAMALMLLPQGVRATATLETAELYPSEHIERMIAGDLADSIRMVIQPLGRVHRQEDFPSLVETPGNILRWLAHRLTGWRRLAPRYRDIARMITVVCPHLETDAPREHLVWLQSPDMPEGVLGEARPWGPV